MSKKCLNSGRTLGLSPQPSKFASMLFRYLPVVLLSTAIGVSGTLPAFIAAISILTVVTCWLFPLVGGNRSIKTEDLINKVVMWFGGWSVVSTSLGIAAFFSFALSGSPAFAILGNAKAAAEKSIGTQLGTGAVDFFFGGLLVIFFFVIAGALLAGGIQVARSENPGTFFLTAFVFALILGALEFFDKIMFTGAVAGPAAP